MIYHPLEPAFLGRPPTGRPVLNRLHPLASKMVGCWVFNAAFHVENLVDGVYDDFVRNQTSGTGGLIERDGIRFVATNGGTDDDTIDTSLRIDDDEGPIVFAIGCRPTSFPNSDASGNYVIGDALASSNNVGITLRFTNDSGTYRPVARWDMGSGWHSETVLADGAAAAVGEQSRLVGVLPAGNIVDGTLYQGQLPGIVGTDGAGYDRQSRDRTHAVRLGGGNQFTNFHDFDGTVAYCYWWANQGFTAEDARAVNANPYAPYGIPLILDSSLALPVWPSIVSIDPDRLNYSGIPLPLIVGQTPNASPDAAWRARAAWSISMAALATSGAGAHSLARVVMAGSASEGIPGAGAHALASVAQAGSASEGIPGAGAHALASVAQAGSASEGVSGAGVHSLASVTQVAVALMQPDGSGVHALAPVAQAGSVSHSETATGAGVHALAPVAQAAVVTLLPDGAGAHMLAAIVQVASGAEEVPGAGAHALAPAAQAGSGDLTEEISGAGAHALAKAAQAATALMHPAGAGAHALAPVAQAGVGSEGLPGVGAHALAPAAQAGSGTHSEAITGAGAHSLASVVQAAVTTMRPDGSGAYVLVRVSQAGASSEGLPGAGTHTLAPVTQAGSGAEVLPGTAAHTLARVAQAAVAALLPDGAGGHVLARVAQAAVAVGGVLGPTPGVVTLFGLDIAQIVVDEIAGAGDLQAGTLTKREPGSRTGGSLTGGTNPTGTTHALRGFVETGEVRRDGQVGATTASTVTVLGKSVSPIVIPEVNDEVTLDGVTYTLVELLYRDPAEATYEFRAEAADVGTPALLFGVDISQIVADEIAEAGDVREGILTKVTPGSRTGGSLTGGTNPTGTGHIFKGFVETREDRRDGQVGASFMSVLTILGSTVSPTGVPEVNDEVALDGVTYTLLELLSRDPVGATYEFRTEAS